MLNFLWIKINAEKKTRRKKQKNQTSSKYFVFHWEKNENESNTDLKKQNNTSAISIRTDSSKQTIFSLRDRTIDRLIPDENLDVKFDRRETLIYERIDKPPVLESCQANWNETFNIQYKDLFESTHL